MKQCQCQWSDHVLVLDKDHGHAVTPHDISFDDLRTRLLDDPAGIKECRYDELIDPTKRPFYKLPAGAILRYIAIKVIDDPKGGGYVALGTVDLPAKYGKVRKKIGAGFAILVVPSILVDVEALHLTSVDANGVPSGTLNNGRIRVALVYDIPNQL